MSSTYLIGNPVRVQGIFRRTKDKRTVDPPAIKVRVTAPDNTTQDSTYPSVGWKKLGTGIYSFLTNPTTQSGTYYYRFYCDDSDIISDESSFEVEPLKGQ